MWKIEILNFKICDLKLNIYKYEIYIRQLENVFKL